MNFFRKHIFCRIFTFFFALQILNLSVDAPDLHPYGRPDKDLAFNEINSISEFVMEQVLKINNAFPEYPDRNNRHDSSPPLNHVSFFFQQPASGIIPEVEPVRATILLHRDFIAPLNHSGDITTPPPRTEWV